jgi:hypothetical protein
LLTDMIQTPIAMTARHTVCTCLYRSTWDRGFEPHSSMDVGLRYSERGLCCPVDGEALTQADPPSKEFCRKYINKFPKHGKWKEMSHTGSQ